MTTSLVEKASGLFDRHFLLAVWFPTFLASVAGLVLGLMPCGAEQVLRWWNSLDGPLKAWLPALALLLVTALATVLQAFTMPLIRIYEGYWPLPLQQLVRRGCAHRWEALRKVRSDSAATDIMRYAQVQAHLHFDYPPTAQLLLPTRLGNALRSAETYPRTVYGLDAVLWWPRLQTLLPSGTQESAAGAFLQLTTLLNFATLALLVGGGGSVYLWGATDLQPRVALIALLSGIAIAGVAYEGAVAQAKAFGLVIRAAFDLHRLDLLRALHQPLPPSLEAELSLWASLESWLYNFDRGAGARLSYQHPSKGGASPDGLGAQPGANPPDS